METAQTTITPKHIGRAGLSLVCFHLARMGYEFTTTTDNSVAGDIWADLGNGPEVMEVKATLRPAWTLRRCQAARTKWYVLVNVADGDTWLVAAASVASLWQNTKKDALTLMGRDMPELAQMALHRQAPRLFPESAPPKPRKRRELVSGRIRRVKKRLANGEVKIYEYRY